MRKSINKKGTGNKEKIDATIFQSLFDNSISGILYGNPDTGDILDANSAAALMFGYSIDELRKLNRKNIFDFQHHSMINSLKVRQKNGEAKGELIGIRKNGEFFPCEFSSSIFKNEEGENRTSTILNDISERKNAEEETLMLLNNTEENFVLVDKALKIISFNKQFEKNYKYFLNKQVMKGDYILDFAQENRKDLVENIYKKVLNGETIDDEIVIPNKDDGTVIFSICYKPAIDDMSNIIGVFVTSRNITDNKKIEQQIITNENRFRSIIEHTGDLITMTDAKGNFIYVSPSVERIIGVDKNKLINKPYKFVIHPDFIEESKEVFDNLIKNPGLPFYRTTKILHQDGHYIWVEGVVTNLLLDENVRAIISNYRDISEEIVIKQKKEFEKRDKEALINSTDDLIWSVSKDFKLIAGNNAFINSLKKSAGVHLKAGDSVLLNKHFKNEFIIFWKNLYEKALDGIAFKQEVYTAEKEAWSEVNLNPIYNENEIMGVACFSRNITAKRNAQLKLKESFHLFEKLTDKIPAALYQFEIDTDGKMRFPYISSGIKYINPSLDIELLKVDASSIFESVHPEDLNRLIESINFSKNNLTDWVQEYRSILDNNKIVWIIGNSSPEKKSDGTITWYGYFQNITEQKNSNEKIRVSKERYDIIAKATNDTIWDVDLLANRVTWNKGIQGIYGYKFDEVGMNERDWWYSKIHPDDIERVKKNIGLRIANQESRWEDEYRFLCFDGTYKYVNDRGFLVVKDSKPIRMIGAMQDITERKLVEEKYFESELRFKTIFEAEPECVKLVDVNGMLIEMNKAGLAMLEANNIQEINSHSLINFVLPKYHYLYKELHQKVILGLESYLEYEAIGLRGTKRWMETNAVPIKDVSGVVTMILSVTRDISNRKMEERHLKLLESVITNTNDSIMITEAEPFDDPGPKIVYVNEAFTRMTGYSKDEVIGKSPRILQGQKSDRNELKRMRDHMKKWKPCEITILNYKKDGSEFWNNFSVKPIADETGWYTHWIAVEKDVTEQKNSEFEREQIIAELSQNNKDLKQFSYVTSHNLRAPIANLLGLTSLIEQYKIPNKSLKKIIDGVRQSALIFDDTVKDLSKVLVIKDQTSIIKEEVLFVAVTDNVLRQLSIAMDDKTVKINYEFSNAPFALFTSAYMESILLNLFTNSLKYRSHKRKLKIDILSYNSDEFVILKFKDNGIGIDIEKYKDKLFKLYQRFHDNPDGKGLGLYLIKSQIEVLGGTIEVESEVDKGTTFIIKFKK